MRRWLGLFAVLALAAVAVVLWRARLLPTANAPTAVAAAASPVAASAGSASPGFVYQRLALNTGGDAPEACLVFSKPLAGAEAHYADYLGFSPPAQAAVRVDGGQLCLGGLAFGTDYTLTLRRGLPAARGDRLAADQSVTVQLGDRPKLIDIAGDGFILPRETAHGLAIQTVNVRTVRLHVLRMNPVLLAARQAADAYPQTKLTQNAGIGQYEIRNLLRREMAVVWSGSMAVAEDHNHTVTTAFPIARLVDRTTPGVYLVVAEDAARALPESFFRDPSGDDSNTGNGDIAAHWVISTDIALTTFAGTDGLSVFARSLKSALPLAHVRVRLLASSQDVLGEAETDDAGAAHFAPGLLRGRDAAAPALLTALGSDGDFTLLDMNRPAFDFSDRGVTGRPSPAPLQAFLYTDRGIYRPGQTIQAVALLRDRLGNAAAGLPLTLILRRPDGVEARRFAPAARADAGFVQPIALTPTAARGHWTIEARADPTAEPIGRISVEVQDYVPQQLKVALDTLPEHVEAGTALTVGLHGDFLYGAPAAGLHGELELRVSRDAAPVPGFAGWNFGPAGETVEDKVTTVPLPAADAHGDTRAAATPELPEGARVPLKLSIKAGLFEPSGRLVADTRDARLATQKLLIGLKPRFANAETDEDVTAPIDVRAFGADGAPQAAAGLRWRVIWRQQIFDWFENDGAWHWHVHAEDKQIDQGTLDVSKAAPGTIARRYSWGEYRLVVEDPASGAVSSVDFHAGWGNSTDTADTPEKVEISADRDRLPEDGAAQLRIRGPFAGHAQLVVANDRVLETRDFDVPREGTTIAVSRRADWGAGAYALVTMVRPLAQVAPHAPVRAVGLIWLGADTSARTLTVTLGAPAQVRPQRALAVPVHITNIPISGSVHLTLAAVDEGVLQLTKFASPDPVGFLFGKRALGVTMRDDYGRLLDGSADPGQITGGDEGLGGAGLPVTSTRTVALFSGLVAPDAAGNAIVTLDVPDFEGQLRLMAVAYGASGVGQASETVIVRDPVVADVAVPRFLGTGDDAQLAVSLHNTDGPAGHYALRVRIGGALTLAGSDTVSVDLQPGERRAGRISIHGGQDGVGTIDADLTGPGLAVHRAWQMAVRAPHFPITLEQSAWQAPGAAFTVDPRLLAAFVPGSASMSLGYSGFAGIDVPSLVQALDRYPYGCTEQLVSTAYPLLYIGDPTLLGSGRTDAALRDRVQGAIDAILDRQGADGEFGLWRAADYRASAWLNVYVADFLTHAERAGYTVPRTPLALAYARLPRIADGETDDRMGEFGDENGTAARAYAQYMLASIGRADIGALRRWHDTLDLKLVADQSVWTDDKQVFEPLALGHLAGALALMGDRPRARSAMAQAITNVGLRRWPPAWFDFEYATALRDIAGLLAIAAEIGDDGSVAQLTAMLQARAGDQGQLDTASQAALLAAAHALNARAAAITLDVNGARSTLGATPALRPAPAAIAAGYTVTNTGERPVWRTLAVHGAPLRASRPIAGAFSLEKQYFGADGNRIDPARLAQNDRVIVALHGFARDALSHRTVLVDLLPAGWEIEAPVGTDTQFAFLGPLSNARVREARDDRFVAALDIGADLLYRPSYGAEEDSDKDKDKPTLAAREFRVAYVARAVTPGHFWRPEAIVEDMYRPALTARTAAGTADVVTK